MILSERIRLFRGRVVSRLRALPGRSGLPGDIGTLTPEAKAAAGCCLAAAAMFVAGLISVLGMGGARGMLANMTEESLPSLEAAVVIEQQVYATMAHLTVYSLTGDMVRYSLARELLANIRTMAGSQAAQAGGPIFREKALPVWELIRKLDRLIEEDRGLTEKLIDLREKLREDAARLKPPPTDLVGRALIASLRRDRAELEKAEGAFAAAAPAAADCLASLRELRRGLDAGLDMDKSRIKILDALAVEIRGMAARSAGDMASAAKNAESALHGAMLTLMAAVGLGCFLALGAAALLLRRSREKQNGHDAA